ncbi:hypothetical protein [Actinomadura sp. 3N407]|uniref:hypothetical protein n=1 Tax=Actinomadura sp. 3N407 TaxID=3457423 RepID=UPI003FCD0AE6
MAGIGLAAVLISASPAHAGTDIPPAYSVDMGAGGKFTSTGEAFQVCDLKLDGLRARMYIRYVVYRDPGLTVWENVGHLDDTTANGVCVDKSINIPDGKIVQFRICTFRASESKNVSCRWSKEGRA